MRPRTIINCFVSNTLSSKAKQLRNDLGCVLGQKTSYKIVLAAYLGKLVAPSSTVCDYAVFNIVHYPPILKHLLFHNLVPWLDICFCKKKKRGTCKKIGT